MNIEQKERILSIIDQLGAASVKQLHQILNCGSYRNTCKIISQLESYLTVLRSNQKIVYLNKEGRQLIGSEKEVKKSIMFDHMLFANEAYIYYDCPLDWKREYIVEIPHEPRLDFEIQFKGLTISNKKTIIPDAVFTRNGYVHLIEIDNTRTMQDNRKKIEKYKEMWPEIKMKLGSQPKLCIFTLSEKRKKEFAQLCEKIPCEIKIFKEI